MLTSLWNTFGLGTPVTPFQKLGRAAICAALAIGLYFMVPAITPIMFIISMMLCFMSGGYVRNVIDLVVQEMERREQEDNQPASVEEELILDPDRDYVVNPGEPVWLTVGLYSVRIMQKDQGRAHVQTYHLYREDEDPITDVVVDQ